MRQIVARGVRQVSSSSNRVLFIALFPVFAQCLCALILYLRAQSKASQATPTYVNTPVASPIRGNGAEIMAARASMRKRKE